MALLLKFILAARNRSRRCRESLVSAVGTGRRAYWLVVAQEPDRRAIRSLPHWLAQSRTWTQPFTSATATSIRTRPDAGAIPHSELAAIDPCWGYPGASYPVRRNSLGALLHDGRAIWTWTVWAALAFSLGPGQHADLDWLIRGGAANSAKSLAESRWFRVVSKWLPTDRRGAGRRDRRMADADQLAGSRPLAA